MNTATSIQVKNGVVSKLQDGDLGFNSSKSAVPSADIAQFESALNRHMQGKIEMPVKGSCKPSLSDKLIERTTNLASSLQQDQQYVSKLLEQATRTGDSMQLMKAMLALGDYQIRVQTVSKTVSKATSSFEQLTKLQ